MPNPVVEERPPVTTSAPPVSATAPFDPLQGNVLGDPLGVAPTAPTVQKASTKPEWSTSWNAALEKKPDAPSEPEDPNAPKRERNLLDGDATFRSGGGTAKGGQTSKVGVDKFETGHADGRTFALNDKGVELGRNSADGISTTTFGLGNEGATFARKSADPNSKQSFTLGVGKKSSIGYTNANGTGGSVGFDAEKGQVNIGGSYGGYKGQLDVGKNGGTLALGNKDFGGSATLKMDEHTLDIGASGYYAGFGAGVGYHGVTDKRSATMGEHNSVLGTAASGVTTTNETGWNANVGIKIVNGGAFSNDVSTTSFATADDGAADPKARAARAKALEAQANKGKDGMSFSTLQNGETTAFSEADGGGFDVGVNALGIARYGYSRSATDIDNGAIGKRSDGTMVASHTAGYDVASSHDYGALWGVYGGKTGSSSANESTMGVSSKDANSAALLEKFAKDGKEIEHQALGLDVGDDITPGITVDHTRSVERSGYTNEQSAVFGLGAYNHASNEITAREAALIDGGSGAQKSTTQVKSSETGGSVLGVGGSSAATDVASSSTVFTGANKQGQTDAENKADFARLKTMTDKGADAVDIKSMKSSEVVAYNKSTNKEKVGTVHAPIGSAKETGTKSAGTTSSMEVQKFGSGAAVKQTVGKEWANKDESSTLWGLSSSSSNQGAKVSGTVQVAGATSEINTLEKFVKSGILTQGALDKVKAKDNEIAAWTATIKDLKAEGNAYKIKYAESELARHKAERQEMVDTYALMASQQLKPGQKLDGVTVQGTSSSLETSSGSASGSWWGFGTSRSGTQSTKLTAEDKLVKGGTQSRRTATLSQKEEINSDWKARSVYLGVTSGPGGSSITYSQAGNASDNTAGGKIKVDLASSDIKAIADKYNKGETAPAFWQRMAKEAAGATATASLKAVFTVVKGPADFQKLTATQQQAFVDAVLLNVNDSNPFEVIAAVELMGLSDAKAEAYMKMFQRTMSSDTNGDASVLNEKFNDFLAIQAKTDPALAKALRSKATLSTL
jgi:hypothetical protein